MSFFSSKPKDHLNLIVDIQSSVVRGSLVIISHDKLPRIVWTSDTDIPYRADGGSSYLIDTTVAAVGAAASSAHAFVRDTKAHPDIPDHITRAHCVLSSPWIFSQARTVSQNFDKDTRITRHHVGDIITTERNTLSKSGGEKMIGIEEKIFDVRLNGYSIQKWEGNMAKTLEISFAVSMASKKTITSFTEQIKKSGVHGSNIDFHSSLLLQHVGMSSSISLIDPYILIHIHGELTDIVVASGQTCILFGSQPIGIRTIIRQLMDKQKISESAADSALSLYENVDLDPLHGSAESQSIQSILSAWVDNCLKVIALTPANYHPTKVVISSRLHEKVFMNSFSAGYPSIKTNLLPAEDIHKLANFDPQTEVLRLTALYVTAVHSLENL